MRFTKKGFDKLRIDYENLIRERPAAVVDLKKARDMGDLSENSDYQSAKEDLAFIDGRSAELEELIKNSKVITPQVSDKVDFGNSVKVKLDGQQEVFQIVGEWEANPAEKKISHSSPLGQALLGKKVGDKVEVAAPAGKIVYTIVAIE